MISATGYSLRNLFNPHGRDGRKLFWRYFLFVVLLNIFVLAIVAIPPMAAMLNEMPMDAANIESGVLEADLLRKMAENGLAERLVKSGLALGFLNITLLSGSIIRRCHDAGLPGVIVMVPLSLQLVWMFFSYKQLANIETTIRVAAQAREAGQEAAIQPGMIAQDLLGWIVILIVVLIGLAKSQPVPNRYGEGPTAI